MHNSVKSLKGFGYRVVGEKVFGWDNGLMGRVVSMEDAQQVSDTMSDKAYENTQETRDEMLSRHRKEISKLQDKETEMKKAAAKGSKAEQKAKKKQVEEDITRLSANLKEKHAAELASLGYSASNGNEKSKLDTLVKAIAGVSVTSQPEQAKPSKSLKRREKEGSARCSQGTKNSRRAEQPSK
ncbi:unnamed protein product [Malus baccata var. baccata]|uniref:Uncharacterized protein n=1 Tax=Malus domestica TaxID=3750 RepID=A0A498JFJ0_MALDO|nr:hypothetical protein DVH24_033499 [Malus domestica]